MLPLGEVRDLALAQDLRDELLRQNIPCEMCHLSSDKYLILISNEDQKELALEIYNMIVHQVNTSALSQQDPDREKIRELKQSDISLFLIAISIITYIAQHFLAKEFIFKNFYISSYVGEVLFIEVKQGEFWRLLTPMFLHFGIMHILFNMLWLKDLGKIIHHQSGRIFYILLVIIVSALSNIGQYLVAGPTFGGMSGVVYGLVGYLWMIKVLKDNNDLQLPKSDIYMMIGWFFLCLLNLFNFQAANFAHAIGLTSGMLFGIIQEFQQKKAFKIAKYLLIALSISGLTYIVDGTSLFRKGPFKNVKEEKYAKRCEAGQFQSCYILAGIYQKRKDLVSFMKYLELGCQHNGALACHMLGLSQEHVDDKFKALYYFKKACDLNHEESCEKFSEYQ